MRSEAQNADVAVATAVFATNEIAKRYLNRHYALDFLLRAKMPVKSGTSGNFASHRNDDYDCEAKLPWSTRFYWPFDSHDKTLMNNPGLKTPVKRLLKAF